MAAITFEMKQKFYSTNKKLVKQRLKPLKKVAIFLHFPVFIFQLTVLRLICFELCTKYEIMCLLKPNLAAKLDMLLPKISESVFYKEKKLGDNVCEPIYRIPPLKCHVLFEWPLLRH